MSKFKVGDKVLFGNQVVEITQIFDSGKCMVSNGWLQNSAWIDDLESYKTPHERLLDLGWILESENEDLIVYRFLQIDYYFYIKINKKTRKINLDYISDFGYITATELDLELAEILVDYLQELSFR